MEDDPSDAQLTLAALKTVNLAGLVDVVSDGVEALDFLNTRGSFCDRSLGDLAAVLLDIKLPRVDGLEVLEQMRSSPALHLIPVVMLTSSQLERDVKHAYELGANAYVVKCIDFSLYTQALRILGKFWTATNCPPPGSSGKRGR